MHPRHHLHHPILSSHKFTHPCATAPLPHYEQTQRKAKSGRAVADGVSCLDHSYIAVVLFGLGRGRNGRTGQSNRHGT